MTGIETHGRPDGESRRGTTFHDRTADEVLRAFGVIPETGLSSDETRRRHRKFGPNRLRAAPRRSAWKVLIAQFESIIVYLLAAGAAISFLFREWADGGAILVVLVINTLIGFTSELRAVRSMEALRRLSRVQARVRRDGASRIIPSEEIVPGDIVVLEGGDVVPADLRLVQTSGLECDESMLTGESLPVAKGIDTVAPKTPLAERSNMAYKGTAITGGSGLGVAVAIGMATELGRVATLVESAESQTSPLEKRLDRLGGQLVWVTLALTALIAVAGILSGRAFAPMIETAIALAVAAVPEGLPIVATVALARGMWRMARRNALIKDLSAVETLGATTVIFTDKTGTLTENRMAVVQLQLRDADVRITGGHAAPGFTLGGKRVAPQDDPRVDIALRVGVLCNNASLSLQDPQAPKGIGDPMEVALLTAGHWGGLERHALLQEMPEVREEAFSAATKMMATFHSTDNGYLVAIKGAPEAVLAGSTHILGTEGAVPFTAGEREQWTRYNDTMASQSLRVLALAMKHTESEHAEPYTGLTWIGLVGLQDPPRADVADAIAACRGAGVRVVMLTGDHAGTAREIAYRVGLASQDAHAVTPDELGRIEGLPQQEQMRLLQAPIFARVSPETKLDLVSLYQHHGAVVAMTGDGVNDAPALKKADIGIAMGQRGTEVAREAADMVLRDDAFPSIVAAMRQGRVIYGNIRRFVFYLMSCNLSEILVIGLATLVGLPLPLLPLQILFLNLVTDVFPAFALGVGEGAEGLMRRPPRNPKEPVLPLERWIAIALYGLLITAVTLGTYTLGMYAFGLSNRAAITVSFLTLACAQLWHVFNMREADSGLLSNEVTRNPFIWGALALCLGLLAGAVYIPTVSGVLGLMPPDGTGWALIAIGSLIPLLVGQAAKQYFKGRISSARGDSVKTGRIPAHQ